MRSVFLPVKLHHFKSFAPPELREECSATCSHFSFHQEYDNLWKLYSCYTTFSFSMPSLRGDKFSSF